jgi:uncharacterized membrane-anchored protein YitT (DUF2179 family)
LLSELRNIFLFSLILLFVFDFFCKIKTSNNQKHKRQIISSNKKHRIIETLKAEPKTCDLVKHFNGKDAYTTIDIILNNVDKIMQAIDNNGKNG